MRGYLDAIPLLMHPQEVQMEGTLNHEVRVTKHFTRVSKRRFQFLFLFKTLWAFWAEP